VFTNLDLHQARSALPTRIEAWPLPYALYRMRPAPAEPPAERRLTNDLELAIGPGNMGWRGFSRVRVERPEPAADPIPDAPETPAGPVTGRWARADAGFVLPGGSHGEVWLLLYAPDAGKPAPRLSLSAGADWTPESALQPDRWQWLRFPLPAGGLKADTWIAMRTDPAWNSRVPGFPDDLGVFVGRILVRPPPGGGRAAPGSARRTRR